MDDFLIILDNGHGSNTPGKRSPLWPDLSQLFEWEYTREIATRLEGELWRRGFKVRRLVPEERDVPLSERCARANELAKAHNTKKTILVSIHCDAAGNGKPMSARGWSVRVSKNASVKSKRMAMIFISAAKQADLKVREYSPTIPYWTQDLAICRDTICPAVLTENLFMDNKEDCHFLLSEEGKKTIVKLHIEAITNIINEFKSE